MSNREMLANVKNTANTKYSNQTDSENVQNSSSDTDQRKYLEVGHNSNTLHLIMLLLSNVQSLKNLLVLWLANCGPRSWSYCLTFNRSM